MTATALTLGRVVHVHLYDVVDGEGTVMKEVWRPAIVVEPWEGKYANVMVLLDGTNDITHVAPSPTIGNRPVQGRVSCREITHEIARAGTLWMTSVFEGTARGEWRWPPRESSPTKSPDVAATLKKHNDDAVHAMQKALDDLVSEHYDLTVLADAMGDTHFWMAFYDDALVKVGVERANTVVSAYASYLFGPNFWFDVVKSPARERELAVKHARLRWSAFFGGDNRPVPRQ